MEELHLGYVKVLSGVSAGRIGRYTCDDADTGKAKMYFGYQSDHLRFQNYKNCKKVAVSNLTNHITKENLVDRYFFVLQDLNGIDLNSHRKIKKYSAEHTDLITECNLIRALLREAFGLQHLNPMDRDQNVLLHFSFLDALWAQDVSLSLEEAGLHVAWNDHELWDPEENLCDRGTGVCRAHIFALSRHTIRESWLNQGVFARKQGLADDEIRLLHVKADAMQVPPFVKEYFDLQNPMSDEYYRALQLLTSCITT